jgi:hypothetical protein
MTTTAATIRTIFKVLVFFFAPTGVPQEGQEPVLDSRGTPHFAQKPAISFLPDFLPAIRADAR